MAGIVFSLLKGVVIGFGSGIWILKLWQFIKSLGYQIGCWSKWTVHIEVRLWIEYFWGLVASLVLPFIWPIILLVQIIFGVRFSSSKLNERRNSFQSFERRRKWQLNNYNFFSYWYLSNCNFKVMNEKHGTFKSTYAIYSWWASLLLRRHIILGDVDISTLLSDSVWAGKFLLSIPYEYFGEPPKKPPDGCILGGLVILFICVTCTFSIIISIIKIFGLKIGIITFSDFSSEKISSDKNFAFTTVHVLKSVDLNKYKAFSSFDSNSATALVDNCANIHIWNERSQFDNFRTIPKNSQGVSTIGGQPHIAEGIGDVTTSWCDDKGEVFRHTLKDVLHFKDSPVKIISPSKLATEWGPTIDREGTYITTKYAYSYFTWKFGEYSRTIQHPHHCLPELSINDGYSSFRKFCNYCSDASTSLRSRWSTFYSVHTNILESHSSITFSEGDVLRYSRDGFTRKCKVLSVNENSDEENKYQIKLDSGRIFDTSSIFLQHLNEIDVACIPEKETDYEREIPRLSPEELSSLANPVPLSPEDQEWLYHHNRLNHIGKADMHKLAVAGVLPKSLTRYKLKAPFCASCAFGKAHRRQWRHKGDDTRPIRSKKDDAPGVTVSVDQMVSAQPGLVPQTSGYLTRSRIHSSTTYIDHHSSYAYSFLQRSTSGEETINSKVAFEKMANEYNVRIKSYHADNGRFAEAGFKEDCKRCSQNISFCAVGAHHQNGIAEAGIKRFTLSARTSLLHAKRLWPEAVTTMLWPFALQYSVEVYNTFHFDSNGMSPLMKFSGVQELPKINNFHPFGCPVYVLECALQTSSKGLPKWDPRCRLGIYLGHSPLHLGSVALVLNPSTGHVSPQYHVVFDDNFTTVSNLRSGTVPSNWKMLVEKSSFSSTDEQYSLSDTWLRENTFGPHDPESAPPMVDKLASSSPVPASEGAPNLVSEGDDKVTFEDPPSVQGSEGETSATSSTTSCSDLIPDYVNLESSGARRSSRVRKVTSKAAESYDAATRKMHALFSKFQFVGLTTLTSKLREAHSDLENFNDSNNEHLNSAFSTALDIYHRLNSHFDCTLNVFSTFAFASAKHNDTYTFKEMMQQEDKGNFMEAMVKEVDDHVERRHWSMIPRSMMPAGMKTILAIWSVKRKRLPDGTITKWKARLCCHCGMQQWGVNYWETYAPVVCWASVRLILIITMISGLPTRSVDFVLAFPQADVDVPVYMELPVGFDLDNGNKREYVLKLNKNLYGLRQANFTWFEMLSKGLTDRGFTPSAIDSCVFIRDNCIVLVYVDDCIVISHDSKVIDRFIFSMQNGPEEFKLTDDGDLARFLGVEMEHRDDGTILMTQTHLIKRILQACDVDYAAMKSKETPVGKPLLHKDLSGEKRKQNWNYRSA